MKHVEASEISPSQQSWYPLPADLTVHPQQKKRVLFGGQYLIGAGLSVGNIKIVGLTSQQAGVDVVDIHFQLVRARFQQPGLKRATTIILKDRIRVLCLGPQAFYSRGIGQRKLDRLDVLLTILNISEQQDRFKGCLTCDRTCSQAGVVALWVGFGLLRTGEVYRVTSAREMPRTTVQIAIRCCHQRPSSGDAAELDRSRRID